VLEKLTVDLDREGLRRDRLAGQPDIVRMDDKHGEAAAFSNPRKFLQPDIGCGFAEEEEEGRVLGKV
jgi:hypothetical protein